MSKKTISKFEGFHTIVAGITRHGKSYYVKQTFIPMLVEFKPVVVFDRKHEYAGQNAVDHNPDWVGCNGVEEFFDVLQEDGIMVKKVYVINCNDNLDYIAGLKFLQKLQAPCSVIVDEGHDIFLDKELYPAKKHLVKLVRFGAGFCIDTILITQRMKDIPPDIRSQFLSAISFKQNHEADVKVIDMKGWNDAESVMDLKKQEYKIFGELPEHLESELITKS